MERRGEERRGATKLVNFMSEALLCKAWLTKQSNNFSQIYVTRLVSKPWT